MRREIFKGTCAEAENSIAETLIVAALMRPALMAPETNARTYLENLPMKGSLAVFAPLTKALSELRHDFYPRLEDFRTLAGTERERHTPTASVGLREWLTSARSGYTKHQPTNSILHSLTASDGEFGRVVEAALAEKPGAENAAKELLHKYGESRHAIEQLIVTCESESGRHQRNRIRGMALGWICRKLNEGCGYLRDWLDAHVADKDLLDDRRKSELQRKVGALRKVLGALPPAPQSTAGAGLHTAAVSALWSSVGSLGLTLEGEDMGAVPQKVSEALRAPLLRLPAVCQPYAPESCISEFDEERSQQRANLFNILKEPEGMLSPDESVALQKRLEEGGILPATELLERLTRAGMTSGGKNRRNQAATARANGSGAQGDARASGVSSARACGHFTTWICRLEKNSARHSNNWMRFPLHFFRAVSTQSMVPILSPLIPADPLDRHPGIPADFPQAQKTLRRDAAVARRGSFGHC